MRFFSPRAPALARKELRSWINSPALYGLVVFFLLFVTIWFYYLQRFFTMDTATLRPFFSAFPLVFIFVVPVLTMKSWAEERKSGSAEILLTMPFTEGELVLGKFLSSFALVVVMLLLTLPVPLSLLPLGNFDAGVILAEYLGTFLLGASSVSLGLFLSALFGSQGSSFVGTVVVLLGATLLNRFTSGMPSFPAGLLNYLSLSFHFESFSRGLLDSRDIAFFLLTTALFLFLNIQVLLYRRWS